MCAQRKFAISLLSGVAIIFMLALPLVAQVDQAAINGAVSDASGAMVPGARIELLSSANGLHRETVTDAVGIYNFPALPIGSYKITISKEGFSTVEIPRVELSVGQPRTVDVRTGTGAPRRVEFMLRLEF